MAPSHRSWSSLPRTFSSLPSIGRTLSGELRENEAVNAGLQREATFSKEGRLTLGSSSASASASTPPTAAGAYHHKKHSMSGVTYDDDHYIALKLGYKQRWLERCFVVSYMIDFVVGFIYDPILEPHVDGHQRPVVLIPGWCGRTKSFKKMAERLKSEGHPVYPVPLGSQLGCIDRKAGLISKFLDKHGLKDVYVVAHSMGGLISVRSMMKGETRIRRLITLGTPYRGTHVIYLGYTVALLLVLALSFYLSPIVGSMLLFSIVKIPSLWQMQPSSKLLTEVLDYLSQITTPVQCVYAVRDQIVVHNWRDAWSPTRLGREDDLCLPEYGHMNLFMGDSGVDLTARLLARYQYLDSLPATTRQGSMVLSPSSSYQSLISSPFKRRKSQLSREIGVE